MKRALAESSDRSTSSVTDELEPWLVAARRWVDEVLERHLPPVSQPPARLHEAMRYALFGGGKRLRPILVRLVCEAEGGTSENAERAACAIELVHTYSLVHDDLPCMDDDDLRRGRATCHVAFDEATAVLAGDALLTLAFELLARPGVAAAAMVQVLARAAGSVGMVGGQVLDLELEDATRAAAGATLTDPDAGDAHRRVREIHRLKTAALFAASTELGALAAGADEGRRAVQRDFGSNLGLLFQAVDDLLDVTGDAATLGKTPGKDARHDRPTLVRVLGVEGARAEADRLGAATRQAALAAGFGASSPGLWLVDYLLERRT